MLNYFPNLAGRSDADAVIIKELRRHNVQIVNISESPSDVKTHIGGKLGTFSFRRYWYYWSARGNLPLHIAKRLYRHPHAQAIRATGYAGGTHPTQVSIRIAPDGREVGPKSEEAGHLAWCARRGRVNEYLFTDDHTLSSPYVTSYHIDTPHGLGAFVKALRKYKLV